MSSHGRHVKCDENEPASGTYMYYKEETIMGHIEHERLPKYKMASRRFTFVHVLRFGNEFNEKLCCRFIFTNLQFTRSLDKM